MKSLDAIDWNTGAIVVSRQLTLGDFVEELFEVGYRVMVLKNGYGEPIIFVTEKGRFGQR